MMYMTKLIVTGGLTLATLAQETRQPMNVAEIETHLAYFALPDTIRARRRLPAVKTRPTLREENKVKESERKTKRANARRSRRTNETERNQVREKELKVMLQRRTGMKASLSQFKVLDNFKKGKMACFKDLLSRKAQQLCPRNAKGLKILDVQDDTVTIRSNVNGSEVSVPKSELIPLLGEGAYGQVFEIEEKYTGFKKGGMVRFRDLSSPTAKQLHLRHEHNAKGLKILDVQRDTVKIIRGIPVLVPKRELIPLTRRFAVKRVPISNRKELAVAERELAAAKLHKKLNSLYINKVISIHAPTKDSLFLDIVMELADQNLETHYRSFQIGKLFKNWSENEEKVKFYVRCILRGIETMHENNMVHLDLKLDNLLINPNNGYVQLCDLGASKTLKKGGKIPFKKADACGAADFWSPERAHAKPYGREADWWSFGVMLYVLATGDYPFKGEGKDLYRAIRETRLIKVEELTEFGLSEHAADFIVQLLKKSKDSRMTNNDPNKAWQRYQYARIPAGVKVQKYQWNASTKNWEQGVVTALKHATIVSVNGYTDAFTNEYMVETFAVDGKKTEYFVAQKSDLKQPRIRDHPFVAFQAGKTFDYKELDSGRYPAPHLQG